MDEKATFVQISYEMVQKWLIVIVRPVLSRYLGADFGADLESDLRTKTDQIGSKSVCFAVLDRTIPLFLPIGEPISKIGILVMY